MTANEPLSKLLGEWREGYGSSTKIIPALLDAVEKVLALCDEADNAKSWDHGIVSATAIRTAISEALEVSDGAQRQVP